MAPVIILAKIAGTKGNDGFKQHIKNMFNKFSSYWFTYIYIYIYESYHSEYKEYLLFQKELTNVCIYIYIQLYIYINIYIYIYIISSDK